MINEATADLMREFGCSVTAVFDVEEALAVLEKQVPHAAVLDINIRGRNSFPVADELHKRKIPIVFVTGYDIPSLTGPWSQYSVCRKPCDPEQLKDLLTAALTSNRDHA